MIERTDIEKPIRSREYWIKYWKSMNKKLGFEYFKWD